MKKLTKICLFIVFSLFLINTVSLKAESTLYDDFIQNVSSSSTKHITYKTSDCENLHIINAYIEGYIVVCEKDNKTYVNFLLINKTNDIEIHLYLKESDKEYTKRTYDVNGSTFIYGVDVSKYSEFSISTTQNDVLISVYDYDINELNTILNSLGNVTNGTQEFPKNIVNEPAKNKIINLIIVCGILICIFLGIVIFVIIKAKKVNIKHEEPFYRFRNQNDEQITNETIIDSKYEEPSSKKEESSSSMPSISDPKYLTEIYRKKLNNEISDKEFEAALKRYQNYKDFEDDDE